jgi:N-acetyl-gamma-glutamyl-phosphate reductase
MSKTRVAIINVTGYIGMDLARLLHTHPEVDVVSVAGRSAAGQRLGDVIPHLAGLGLDVESEPGDADFVFCALPHGESANTVAGIVERGKKVVDVGADFRLKDAAEYKKWYKLEHPFPQYLGEAVYGLVELHREEIKAARLVANPGCYPTGAILALAPAVKEGLIEPDIIVDSKSGASGAGRTLTIHTHFAELNENVSAYALDGHRHLPEIGQELQALGPDVPLSITFLPHLIPMSRGILSTCYARLKSGGSAEGERVKTQVTELYRDFYNGETFVKVVTVPPQTKQTLGTNLCLIYPTVDARTGRLVVVSCIDNLVKGGAGQAVQNMNLMLGLPETTGLESLALYP